MDLLVTEITKMAGPVRCIAGWDRDGQRMIRPLPAGQNWDAATIEEAGLSVGCTLTVSPTGRAHPGDFPHSTEDTEVASHPIRMTPPANVNWFGPGAPPRPRGSRRGHPRVVAHHRSALQRRHGRPRHGLGSLSARGRLRRSAVQGGGTQARGRQRRLLSIRAHA